MLTKVSYNELSSDYNGRYRQNPLSEVREKLLEICTSKTGTKILEVGCGTGHWLHELSSTGNEIHGADYSTGMLKIAAAAGENIRVVNADANYLPYKKNSFDILYCINAIHHFNDKRAFISSAFDLIKPGGIFAVFGIDHSDPELNWYVYDYFDNTFALDQKRFPTFAQLSEWSTECGFIEIRNEKVQNIHSVKIGNDVLSDHFITRAGSSQLALLSEEEYEAGLNKIRRDIYAAQHSGTGITFTTNLNIFMLTAVKPKPKN